MKLLRRIGALFRGRKLEAEMKEEMRLHLEMLEERNRAAGMSEEEAWFAALREFGGGEQVKEICREQRGWPAVENVIRDFRFAARSLRRAPLFIAAVIATLALCIGPNTAIFTALYALVLKSPPFHEPDRIVQVYNAFEKMGGGRSRQEASVPQYRDFKDNADLFEDFAIMQYAGTTIDEEGTRQRLTGMRVNAGFFDFLGVKPLLGRFGTAEEDAVGRDRVLVLTQSFWEAHFNGDPAVIGREVRVGGEPWTIIGVAPRSVEGLDSYTRFFKPFEPLPNEVDPLRSRYIGKINLFGRLKPGVLREAALEQLNIIDRRFLADNAPSEMRAHLESSGHRIGIERLGAKVAGAVQMPLSLLQAGAVFVLLIGVVNVLNLTLARVNAKRSELAIRHALGAGAATLLRQLLAESVLLATVAVTLGSGLAWASLRIINTYLPLVAVTALPVEMQPAAIVMAAGVSMALAVLMGIVPFALQWRSGLKVGESRTVSANARVRYLGGMLVVGQVAIALVLLVGAGLLGRSFAHVLAVDPGFDAANLLQARIAVPKGYERPEQNVALQQRIIEGLKEIPGVSHAALVIDYALSPTFRAQPFVLRNGTAGEGESRPMIALDPVSPEFFDTMHIPLLEGRGFTYADDLRRAPVAVVDDLFARRYFPDVNVIGQELVPGAHPPQEGQPWIRIVGGVRRPALMGLEGRDGIPLVFLPMVQQPAAGLDGTTFVGVAVLMLCVAVLACWLPARRAAKVDPMVALRCE